MAHDGDLAPPLRASMDTSANINEDLASALDISDVSRRKGTELIISNLRGSLDGSQSNHVASFNILRLGSAEELRPKVSALPLGPNSIFDLTIASDALRVRLNRQLKTYVTVNGGNNTVYNLKRPTTSDIPQIQLHRLKLRPSAAEIKEEFVQAAEEYKTFEQSYSLLTADMLQLLESKDKDDIPKIFADPKFRLDDPRFFKEVIAQSGILPDPESGESILRNNEVQENLSGYLDQVEVKLVQEISRTLNSFFSALGDIQYVKDESLRCIEQLTSIAQDLDFVESEQAQRGIRILNLLDERQSVNRLEQSVLQLKEIVAGYERAKHMFDTGSPDECLKQLLVTEGLISGATQFPDSDSYPKFEHYTDFSLLPALNDKKRQIHQLKQRCSREQINNFVDLLLEDLRLHYRSVPTVETLNRMYVAIDRERKHMAAPINRSYAVTNPDTMADLRKFIADLLKTGHLSEAFAEYQEKIISEIKSIIRVGLPYRAETPTEPPSTAGSRSSSYLPEGTEPPLKGKPLFASLKELLSKEFTIMIERIYANLAESFRKLTHHQKILLDLSLTTMPANSNIDVMSLDISNTINKGILLTQVRLVKVLNVRLEQLGDMTINDYLHMYSITSAYLSECEAINPGFMSTGQGSSLTDWIKSHIGYFIHRFHLNALRLLATLCDQEIWKEVTESLKLAGPQTCVNEMAAFAKFVESEGKDGDACVNWSSALDFFRGEGPSEAQKLAPATDRLVLGDRLFFVPQLILSAVETIKDYLVISRVFSTKSGIVEANLLVYFKLLNSRVSQAILSAGATRSAGLKHITTKHIALCIQTIEFGIELLETIQPIFKNSKFEFDQNQTEELTFPIVTGFFKDHEGELQAKLVAIMHDRTLIHCGTVKSVDFSKPLVHPQQCHPFMETLVKETSTVAKVLGRYLREQECTLIMTQIFTNYKNLLVKCFCTELPQFKDFIEKHSLLKDIDYFRVKLSEIPGYGNSGQVIWENVNSLPTVEDGKMEMIMRSNIEGERAARDPELDKKPEVEERKPTDEVTEQLVKAEEHDKPSGKKVSENLKNLTSTETNHSETAIKAEQRDFVKEPEEVVEVATTGTFADKSELAPKALMAETNVIAESDLASKESLTLKNPEIESHLTAEAVLGPNEVILDGDQPDVVDLHIAEVAKDDALEMSDGVTKGGLMEGPIESEETTDPKDVKQEKESASKGEAGAFDTISPSLQNGNELSASSVIEVEKMNDESAADFVRMAKLESDIGENLGSLDSDSQKEKQEARDPLGEDETFSKEPPEEKNSEGMMREIPTNATSPDTADAHIVSSVETDEVKSQLNTEKVKPKKKLNSKLKLKKGRRR